MKPEQFTPARTGSRFDLPDGYYLLLTDAVSSDDPVTLWLFSPYHSEEIARRDFNTLHAFHAAWASWDGSNETLEYLFDDGPFESNPRKDLADELGRRIARLPLLDPLNDEEREYLLTASDEDVDTFLDDLEARCGVPTRDLRK